MSGDHALIAAIGLILLFAGLASSCFAPCSWYGCAPVKDVPGRCLHEMVPR